MTAKFLRQLYLMLDDFLRLAHDGALTNPQNK